MVNEDWASEILLALRKLADSPSLTWDQASTFDTLPIPSTCTGETWLVLSGSGIWPANKPAGWYYSDGAVWAYLGAYNPVITGGNVVVTNFPAIQPVSFSGSVTVGNFPATQPISGNVSVSNFPVTQPVSGTVSVNNFPATQPVSGNISVSNFPASQPVTGIFWQSLQPVSVSSLPLPSGASTEATLALIKAKTDNLDVLLSTRTKPADTQIISGAISVSNFPASQAVTGTFWPVTQPVSGTFWQATQPISGSVSVSNFPATQPISGTVTVANFPATQPVSGTFWQVTQPISGAVSVSNFPASQAVTGTFWPTTQPISAVTLPLPSGASTEATLALIKAKTDNLDVLLSTRTKPADTQTISGAVSVSNFPATQPISGTVTTLEDRVTGRTAVLKTGTLVTTAVTADQVILTYTVTAGKTFFLEYLTTMARLTAISATASIMGTISLETPSGTKTWTISWLNPTISLGQPVVLTFSEPLPIAAGTVIRFVCTPTAVTSMTWIGNFGGYEK